MVSRNERRFCGSFFSLSFENELRYGTIKARAKRLELFASWNFSTVSSTSTCISSSIIRVCNPFFCFLSFVFPLVSHTHEHAKLSQVYKHSSFGARIAMLSLLSRSLVSSSQLFVYGSPQRFFSIITSFSHHLPLTHARAQSMRDVFIAIVQFQ